MKTLINLFTTNAIYLVRKVSPKRKFISKERNLQPSALTNAEKANEILKNFK